MLFDREISPDNEMRVIGLAILVSGALNCSGCHYLSVMAIMKQFDAHKKIPVLICTWLLIGSESWVSARSSSAVCC